MNTRLGPELRAMIWKETKENAKWAVLAMIGISLALVFTIAHQMGGNAVNSLGAIWDSAGLVMTFGAPIIGLAFGLLQILPELRRDQWAFLIHRPASRSTLFWGKFLAGLGLTLTATLIPLFCLALWADAPGHIPAPFDPRLLLGGLAAILTGLVFYTAGLLTALRPARWFGSRALPIPMAIICAVLVNYSHEFIGAVLSVGLFLAVLLTAARGSFLTMGIYLRQPRIAKFSLGLTLFLGLVVTLIAAGILIGSTISTLFPARLDHRHWSISYYGIMQTGRILRISRTEDNILKAVDLNGHPVTLPHPAGQPADSYNDFLQEQWLSETPKLAQEYYYNSPERYATVLGTAGLLDSGTIWYYIPSQRQALAYSLDRHRLIGHLGPTGFSLDDTGTSRFPGPLSALIPTGYNQADTLMAFPHALYRLDPYTRSVKVLVHL
jgi:ABC-type transport system involved in multi-copper enzyme maturation permease subunit